MSNLLSQASLVMIPSGYKEDVVYSQIPTDGSGDLAFTRASNGTRVNSAGLVEVCPWNLFGYSEDFANADWIKVGSTISSNVLVAPNGTTTADKLVEDTSNGVHIALQITGGRNVSSIYAFSVYAKAGERTKINLFNNGNGVGEANFDLVNGTATLIAGEFATIEGVGNGWYRCVVGMQENSTAGNFNYHIRLLDASGNNSYTGNGTSGAYIWGAQVNLGTAKPYFPTTDRLNVPRLTYQNGGGGCPSLLLEKQSTNIAYPSQAFAGFSKSSDVSITDNNTISPDGTQNATYYFCNTTTTNGYLIPNFSGTSGVQYAVSFYAKAKELSLIYIKNVNDSGGQSIFDLSNGTYTLVTGIDSMSIVAVGNGWYRCTAISTSSSTNINFVPIIKGNANQGIYIWGLQIEQSSYPTSYIPTTSSSATRVADAMTVNLPNTNMTFTAYLELDEASLGTVAGDWFYIYSNVSILGRAFGWANTFGFADAYSLGVASGAKMVWKQESGSTAKIFKGGALVGTSTTGTYTNPFNRLRIDANYLDKPVKIKQFVFFDNALTDAECAQLTA